MEVLNNQFNYSFLMIIPIYYIIIQLCIIFIIFILYFWLYFELMNFLILLQ